MKNKHFLIYIDPGVKMTASFWQKPTEKLF